MSVNIDAFGTDNDHEAGNWPGLGPHARQIVAAANSRDPRKVFFFLANGTYIRFDIVAGVMDRGYPQAIDDRTWPGLYGYFRHR